MIIKLNEQQLQAAKFLTGICAVVAVPGSGKTLTMTHRIGNLIKNHGVSPEHILGLTFTRNAAQAMKDRLTSIMDDMASRVTLSTIHSFSHSLLRAEGVTFEILQGKDQLIFLKKIMQRLRIKNLSTAMVLREISLAKNNLVTLEEFKDLYLGEETMQQVAEIFDTYEAEKKKNLLLDFDDLLLETYHLLQENESVREKYRQTFRHVLVDEYQDLNPLQHEIIKLLTEDQSQASSLWVCGDDWQSIYAFTGATLGHILKFQEIFPEAQQFILNVNYRSTPQILEACQKLIRHNVRKIEKTLEGQQQNGEGVTIIEAGDEEDEALKVAQEIPELAQHGYEFKNIVILYRANYQSRVMEETLRQLKIPYTIENGINFYERFEVKVLLEYLRLIHSPDSDAGDEALRTIINTPSRYIGRKFMEELEGYCAEKGAHLYHGLKSFPVDLIYVKKRVKEFIALMDHLMTAASTLEPAEAIYILREALNYDRAVTDDEIPSPDDSRIANINQLHLVAAKYKDIPSLLKFSDTFQDNSTHDENGVRLMTIHKAKGLEFPVVFVIGLMEGILPNRQGDIEEERRIAFVALSRAMQKLYLSFAYNYEGRPMKKSRFLDEIK